MLILKLPSTPLSPRLSNAQIPSSSACSRTHSAYFPLNVTVRVSHPYKTTVHPHSAKKPLRCGRRRAGIAHRLATGWTVRGSNAGGGATFSVSVQTGPGAHPASNTMGTGSFPGVQRPGRGVDHPPPFSAEVKKRVRLYLSSPFGPS